MRAAAQIQIPGTRAKALRPEWLARRPEWWLERVAQGTEAWREERAVALENEGIRRAEEAAWVMGEVRSGRHRDRLLRWEAAWGSDAEGDYWLPEERELDASDLLMAILRRWDQDLAASSENTRRLVRDPGEGLSSWTSRIQAECLRRAESHWHSQRARGWRERFTRPKTCGDKSRGWITCADCGHAPLELRSWCANHWACADCRDRRKKRYRSRFRKARTATLAHLRASKLLKGQAPDYMSERFLTLTMPRMSNVEDACEVIRKAWRLFWSRLRAHFGRRYGEQYKKNTRVVRVLEATPGRDGEGHVHIHAWWVGPFARVELVSAMWGQCLRSAGLPDACIPEAVWRDKADVVADLDEDTRAAMRRYPRRLFCPVIDLRLVRTGRISRNGQVADLADELVKYITKDLGAAGLVAPELWAAIYRGLAAGRMITASHWFWVRAVSACPCCTARGSWHIASPGRVEQLVARGPPILHPAGVGSGAQLSGEQHVRLGPLQDRGSPLGQRLAQLQPH